MRLTTKVRYSLRALLDLVVHSKKKKPVQINRISERQDLSERYLENIFTDLRKAGILKSKKGKSGGFFLAKKPSKINLYQIFEALEGEVSLVECIEDPGFCEGAKECFTRVIWKEINESLVSKLKGYTLENLVERYKGEYEKDK